MSFQRIITLYRNAYGGIPRDIWLLAIVMLINRSGTMVIPFLGVYLTQSLHFSLADAGLVVSCAGVGGIVGIYLGGKLTDKFGHYYVQVGSLILGGLLFFVVMQMRSFELLCLTTFLLNVAGEGFRPANSTSIAFYTTAQNRTRGYSLNRLAINLGWSVGPVLGGFFATIGYQYLFIADGVTNILAAVLLLILIRNKNKADGEVETQPIADENVPNSALKDAIFRRFLLFTVLYAMAFMPFFTLVPVYWKGELHIPEYKIGLVIGLNGLLVALVEMILIYFIEHKRSLLTYISWGVLLAGFSYIFLNLFSVEWWLVMALLGVIFMTVSEMLAMPFLSTFTIERATPQTRGQYTALYSMCYSFAHVATPAIGMRIATHFGFPVLWWVLSGLTVLSFLGFRSLQKN